MSPRTHPNDEPARPFCHDPGPTVSGVATVCGLAADHPGQHSVTFNPGTGHFVRFDGMALDGMYRIRWDSEPR